jgi:uncharacterized membrane protein
MATAAGAPPAVRSKFSVKPTNFDRVLAIASIILLTALVIALARGRDEWGSVPTVVWAHIATIFIAVSLTPIMMLRRRGDRLHRRLGWLWAVSLAATAILTFGIRGINQGSLSLIHILSAWTLVQVPLLVWHARRHNHAKHRAAVRGMVSGALLIAGFFTFPFDRLMGHWLFGGIS